MRGRDDSGTTLVELLVTLAIFSVVIASVFEIFGVFSFSSTSTRTLTFSQENVHTVLRILEADVRSADPLLLVPSSFTADPSGSSAVGANGTNPVDVIAMQEDNDAFSACSGASSTTSTSLPSPFLSTPTSANVIWAYSPTTGTLSRYSYCTSSATWTAGMTLTHLANATQTMFQAAQDGATSVLPQAPTPSPTTVTNQGAPLCGESLLIVLVDKARSQSIPFVIRQSVQLPNQTGVEEQEC